jgi:phosphoribosylformylglycinamidine synthase
VRARVVVTLKPEVLDPQGRAIQRACQALGHASVTDVRQGKLFEIVLEGVDPTRARALLQELGEKLLANPVIEDFRVEQIEA